jgi:hypothetical protein
MTRTDAEVARWGTFVRTSGAEPHEVDVRIHDDGLFEAFISRPGTVKLIEIGGALRVRPAKRVVTG